MMWEQSRGFGGKKLLVKQELLLSSVALQSKRDSIPEEREPKLV